MTEHQDQAEQRTVRAARLLVCWQADRKVTEIFLVDSAQHMTLVADCQPTDCQAVLAEIAANHPDLPVDVRPGAIRETGE